MISFQPTEDETAFANVARDFAKDEIRPVARECEENLKVDSGLAKKAEELGFGGLEFPEDWGGLELPLITQAQLLQGLSYGDLGITQGLPGGGDAASLIRFAPDHDAFASYRSAGDDGSWPNTALLDVTDTEAPWAKALSVTPDGDGYKLDGVSAPVRLAAIAEYAAVAATDTNGAAVVLWLDDPSQWQIKESDFRLGLLAAGLSRFQFENARVPANRIIAKGEPARELISRSLARVRVLQAAREVGQMEAALDYATEYTAGRKAFGQEIAKFQGVSFRIADMAIETRAANHLTWQAATALDDDADAVDASYRALYRAHRAVRFVTDSAVQLLGGHGFVNEYPVEKWMRDAEAQVMLYGREKDLLARHGEQLVGILKEGVAQ